MTGKMRFGLAKHLILFRQWVRAVKCLKQGSEKGELYSLLIKKTKETVEKYYSLDHFYEIDQNAVVDLAKQDLQCVEEVHNLGRTYLKFIEKMFYLNDDFNDTTYHLFCAIERAELNSGTIKDISDDIQPYINLFATGKNGPNEVYLDEVLE
jgi:hypothetical protein